MKSSRIWYVEPLNTRTNEFIVSQLLDNDVEGSMLHGVTVSRVVFKNGANRRVYVKVNMYRLSADKLNSLISQSNRLDFLFNIYMQESAGAKFTPWKMGIKKS